MGATADAPAAAEVEVRSSRLCLDHRPGLGHPDQPDRIHVVLAALEPPSEGGWKVVADSPLPPQEDVLGVLKWVHDAEYIERVREAAESNAAWIDSHDCVVSTGTFTAATAAAGLALQAALDLANGRLARAFVALRPPSHHAERGRARGYCFFNAVAVAAEVIVRSWNRPVLIVDFDALHGNGTQQHFWERGDVGYLSVHRYPGFPGGGGGDEVGAGAGIGATRNIPLAAGADDALFCTALENGLDEMAARLEPAAVVVSAGFNGHQDDAVGELRMTASGYRRATLAVMHAAERWASGRVLSFLEGGFAPQALAASVRAHVEELSRFRLPASKGSFPVN